MISGLEQLYHSLKDDNIEIDAIELAEVLWLSKYINRVEVEEKLPKEEQSNSLDADPITINENSLETADSSPSTTSKIKKRKQKKREDAPLYPINDQNNQQSLPFRTPLVRTLYRDNDMIYALRHFRQKRVSSTEDILDEEMTADYIAKTDIFQAFYKKSFEKKFQITFVVDLSTGMKIWETMIDDFIRDIIGYHIFREIKIYYMPTEAEEIRLFKKKDSTNTINRNWHKKETKESLTFILSDMTSKGWSSGRVLEEIMRWQKHSPISIIQMLPQRLWNGTKLLDASRGKMSSSKKFALNRDLYIKAEEILIEEEESPPQLLKIPILNFNEKSIDAYGMVMRSLPKNRISGAMFEKEDFKGEYHYSKEHQQLNAQERLRSFYKYAGSEAKRLLELLAVVPLSFPIIKLVQQKLLPHSSQEHLSEIFMSPIMDKEQKIDGFYQFYREPNRAEGVREELIAKIGAKEAFETIVELSKVINTHGGIFDFLAFVRTEGKIEGKTKFSEIDREFARISVSLLKQMGERYAHLVDRLEDYLEGYEEESLDEDIEIIIPRSKRFMMGSDQAKSTRPIHEVIFNYDFEVGKYPVTLGEFRAFVKDTGYKTEGEKLNGAFVEWDGSKWEQRKNAYWDNPYFEQTEDHPVVCVSWNDANAYIKWLNRKTDENYRLPTESEWEYLCRADTTTKYYFGNNSKELNNHAWYAINSHNKTHPIGQKLPNPWGVHDLYGNIWEWCEDNFSLNYEKSTTDGTAYHENSDIKVLRGASWRYGFETNNSSSRGRHYEFSCFSNFGFRIIKDLNKDNLTDIKQIKNFIKPKMIKIMNSLSIDMIKVPNRDYEIGKYPVTIGEYMHFTKENRQYLPKWEKEKTERYEKMNLSNNAPIIGINWYEARAYCRWLNEEQDEYIYRLPTKEEWEHASKADTQTKWNFGDDITEIDKYAWYQKNSDTTTHIVGEKLPNPWGFYDMYGNVWEWTESRGKGNNRVILGGSWNVKIVNSSFALFNSNNAKYYSRRVGFRVLRIKSDKIKK